ncbi:MAG: OmpA family protein [Acidiferrobacterales bacterium]
MKSWKRINILAAMLSLLLVTTGVLASGEIKDSLFREATAARQTAESAGAKLFAPKTYGKAIKRYQNAERKFGGAGNIDTIRNELAVATKLFQNAAKVSASASTELAAVMKTRADAEKVDAPKYAKQLWQRAEQTFSKATTEFERGATKVAKRKASEAEKIYRDAELATIKTTYLSETRTLLRQAEKLKVHKHAPKTLQKAKDNLLAAEKALNEDRYDLDRPRSLAQQANYEAKHAIYLARFIGSTKDKKLSTEDLIREWELPIERIAAAADIRAAFDDGYDAPTKQVIEYIEDQQSSSQKLRQNNGELLVEVEQLRRVAEAHGLLSQRLDAETQVRSKLEQQVSMLQTENEQLQLALGGATEEQAALTGTRKQLEQELDKLQSQLKQTQTTLGGVAEERVALSQQLQAQARVRKQFDEIEQMFSRKEAQVLRESNDVIIRLVGLNFSVGRSTIDPKHFQLLTKVQKAIRVFPESALTIEGHTDSYGSDQANLALSEKRAEAVKQYLLANMGLPPSKVGAVGFGETKPVANNETDAGRTKNRRIDVVIRPNLNN